MFEQKHQRIAPLSVFIARLATFIGIAVLLILMALLLGIFGYHWIAGLSWVDALLNASMILGGMGPVNILTNTNAKIFASLYALFSGLVFIAVMGIVFSPIIHRILHKFHIDNEDLEDSN